MRVSVCLVIFLVLSQVSSSSDVDATKPAMQERTPPSDNIGKQDTHAKDAQPDPANLLPSMAIKSEMEAAKKAEVKEKNEDASKNPPQNKKQANVNSAPKEKKEKEMKVKSAAKASQEPTEEKKEEKMAEKTEEKTEGKKEEEKKEEEKVQAKTSPAANAHGSQEEKKKEEKEEPPKENKDEKEEKQGEKQKKEEEKKEEPAATPSPAAHSQKSQMMALAHQANEEAKQANEEKKKEDQEKQAQQVDKAAPSSIKIAQLKAILKKEEAKSVLAKKEAQSAKPAVAAAAAAKHKQTGSSAPVPIPYQKSAPAALKRPLPGIKVVKLGAQGRPQNMPLPLPAKKTDEIPIADGHDSGSIIIMAVIAAFFLYVLVKYQKEIGRFFNPSDSAPPNQKRKPRDYDTTKSRVTEAEEDPFIKTPVPSDRSSVAGDL